MGRVKNKVAIVSASTRGIGLSIVKSLYNEGAIVYMAVRKIDLGKQIADELNSQGKNVKVVYFDASQKESYESMIDEVLKSEGRIDILVNNFGGTNPRHDLNIIDCSYDNFAENVELNLRSVFLTSQLAIKKAMIPQKSGSIINISSIASLYPDTTQCAYGTSKAGINHLSKMIAVHTAKFNIRCNVVCPGMTSTDAVATNLPKEYQSLFMKHTPIGRMSTPEEIASTVLYFASDESSTTTGQIIAVCGGYGLACPTYGDQVNGNM